LVTTGTTIAGFELTVRDLERSANFYSAGLGLSIRVREDHGEFQEIHLVGERDTAALLLVNPAIADAPLNTLPDSIKITLLTDDVRKLYAQALGAGAEEVQAPQLYAPLDIWFAQLRDPDGYTVLLTQRHE
jgi:predicted enzyme related to lactoylglutathione lyase